MKAKPIIVLTHGGAGSNSKDSDGTDRAAKLAREALENRQPMAQSVCLAVAELEDDTRFNAGSGSQVRSDGSVQMDAAYMDSKPAFGAVANLEGFKNPIFIAQAVSQTPYRILAGRGAEQFAGEREFERSVPVTGTGKDFSSKDTVGCVAWDGETFAAGLSTGGIKGAPAGRVGDVPLIGCGLYAGRKGAVAATGDGEAITMKLTAYRAYEMLARGERPETILKEVLQWFTSEEAFGILLVSEKGAAGGANLSMAWSQMENG